MVAGKAPPKLSRDPAFAAAIRSVRYRHRAYQRYGHTYLEKFRVVRRNEALAQQQDQVMLRSRDLAEHLDPRPELATWEAARAAMLNTYADDRRLQRELASIKYRAGDPVTAQELERAVMLAGKAFCRAIDESTSSSSGSAASRRDARKAAMRDLESVLSAVSLAMISLEHRRSSRVRSVASGAN